MTMTGADIHDMNAMITAASTSQTPVSLFFFIGAVLQISSV